MLIIIEVLKVIHHFLLYDIKSVGFTVILNWNTCLGKIIIAKQHWARSTMKINSLGTLDTVILYENLVSMVIAKNF